MGSDVSFACDATVCCDREPRVAITVCVLTVDHTVASHHPSTHPPLLRQQLQRKSRVLWPTLPWVRIPDLGLILTLSHALLSSGTPLPVLTLTTQQHRTAPHRTDSIAQHSTAQNQALHTPGDMLYSAHMLIGCWNIDWCLQSDDMTNSSGANPTDPATRWEAYNNCIGVINSLHPLPATDEFFEFFFCLWATTSAGTLSPVLPGLRSPRDKASCYPRACPPPSTPRPRPLDCAFLPNIQLHTATSCPFSHFPPPPPC